MQNIQLYIKWYKIESIEYENVWWTKEPYKEQTSYGLHIF